jgi:hypothetical protein
LIVRSRLNWLPLIAIAGVIATVIGWRTVCVRYVVLFDPHPDLPWTILVAIDGDRLEFDSGQAVIVDAESSSSVDRRSAGVLMAARYKLIPAGGPGRIVVKELPLGNCGTCAESPRLYPI